MRRTCETHVFEVLVLAVPVVALATSCLKWAQRLDWINVVAVSQRLETALNTLQEVRVVAVVLEPHKSTTIGRKVGLRPS